VGRDRLELADFDRVRELLSTADFDVLVNCSSYHKTDEVEGNAQQAFAINAHLVALLAELAQAKSARFVHVSTDYVFGGQDKREPLDEGDARAPVNVYGASKAMGEDLARLACDNTLILRVASLFGVAGASGKGGNFVETMIRF
ncbi:sugar nucleotide-binding protein, partial [Salinisphaera sp. USBA-960]|nr:sugar nucleotide-binding protein [Salifodinibacter halophilus]